MNDGEQYRSVERTYSGYAVSDKLYLQRVYECEPGGVQRFAEHYASTIDARRSVSESLVPVGAWQTLYGPAEEVTHIYEFENLAALQADVDLLLESRATGATPTPGVRSHTSKIMRSLPYCPQQLIHDSPAAVPDDRVTMMMAVFCTRSGVGDFIEHFGHGIEQRTELDDGLVPIGAWRNLYGSRNYELNHYYSFSSLADMEEKRQLMYRDKGFLDRIKINTSPNPPNFWEWGATSRLMKPLSYSRMR